MKLLNLSIFIARCVSTQCCWTFSQFISNNNVTNSYCVIDTCFIDFVSNDASYLVDPAFVMLHFTARSRQTVHPFNSVSLFLHFNKHKLTSIFTGSKLMSLNFQKKTKKKHKLHVINFFIITSRYGIPMFKTQRKMSIKYTNLFSKIMHILVRY